MDPPLSSAPPRSRRDALGLLAAGAAGGLLMPQRSRGEVPAPRRPPNVLFVFSDQQKNRAWQMNNPLISTPRLMQLAAQGTVVQNAVSQTPICSPFRAMLMSGQYPRTSGVIVNDQRLAANGDRLSEVTSRLGYRNGYIGKWHISAASGNSVSASLRHGFTETWKAYEAMHNYSSGTAWYDEANRAVSLTRYRNYQEADEVVNFLDDHAANHADDPFFLVWSLGPPHNPYSDYHKTQPSPNFSHYRSLLNDPVNRPPNYAGGESLDSVAGYYTMCSGIDMALGQVLNRLDALGIADDTIVVYTSDHGDMLGSYGLKLKQKPWEESINIPFVIRYPGVVPAGRVSDLLLGSIDLMPTLLGLMGRASAIPSSVQGMDLSAALCGVPGAPERDALWIGVPVVSSASSLPARPAAAFTGVRTKRHTYASFKAGTVVAGYGSKGGYILHDNVNDPWQMENLVDKPGSEALQANLHDRLTALNLEVGESSFILPARPVSRGLYIKSR
jgi:arylsulfatase A-like enzyme